MINQRHSALFALFLAVLATPLIGLFFGAANFRPQDEQRRPAPLSSPTAWFHDHFGFRGAMIEAQALLKVQVLGASTSPDVVIGKDGWLFYAGDRSMDNYRGVLPFGEGELAGWISSFENRQKSAQAEGSKLLVAIVPDKQSVYPEFMPSSIPRVTPHTRLDALMSAMRDRPVPPVLDLRGPLLEAKAATPVYHRTDTHWNAAGVYASYAALVREIAKTYPDMRPIPWSETIDHTQYDSGDLAKMLGLGRSWREQMPLALPKHGVPGTEQNGMLVFENPDAPPRRLLVLGDSFSGPLVPYLALHFRRTVVSQSAHLAAEHADLILIEMVERKLNGHNIFG